MGLRSEFLSVSLPPVLPSFPKALGRKAGNLFKYFVYIYMYLPPCCVCVCVCFLFVVHVDLELLGPNDPPVLASLEAGTTGIQRCHTLCASALTGYREGKGRHAEVNKGRGRPGAGRLELIRPRASTE